MEKIGAKNTPSVNNNQEKTKRRKNPSQSYLMNMINEEKCISFPCAGSRYLEEFPSITSALHLAIQSFHYAVSDAQPHAAVLHLTRFFFFMLPFTTCQWCAFNFRLQNSSSTGIKLASNWVEDFCNTSFSYAWPSSQQQKRGCHSDPDPFVDKKGWK